MTEEPFINQPLSTGLQSEPSFAPGQSRFSRILDALERHRAITLCVTGFIILVEIVWAVSSFQGGSTVQKSALNVPKHSPQSTTIAGAAENKPVPPGVSLSLQTDAATVPVGKTVTITATLNTALQNTDGTTAVILYNPAVLQYQKVANGTLYPSYIPPLVDQKAGRITITGITGVSSFYKGTGIFAKVLFTAKAKGTAALTFDFTKGSSKATAVASDKKDILGAVSGTSVKIE